VFDSVGLMFGVCCLSRGRNFVVRGSVINCGLLFDGLTNREKERVSALAKREEQ